MDQDSSYWADIRPIALTGDEVRDYAYKDSLEVVQNSPAYLDSLTEARRKIGPMDILINGWGFTNYRTKTSWRGESMLETLGFNPMEGFYVAPSVSHRWDWEEKGSLNIRGRLRYGFADEQLGGSVNVFWQRNPAQQEYWTLEGGRYPRQYGRYIQISPSLNTFYGMINHESFIRLYRSSYVRFSYSRQLLNGLSMRLGFQHEGRRNMSNNSEYSVFNQDRLYPDNLESPQFSVGAKAWVGSINLRFQPFNRYISTPKGKINMGSAWPRIGLSYRKAFAWGNDPVAYATLTASLSQTLNLKVLGSTQWRVSGGTFLENSRTELPDLFHFKGNETVFRRNRFDQFALMPYYAFASSEEYVEAHAEHAFGGYILNKVPFIRRLKLNEFVGIHALWQEGNQPYAELNFGIEARVFRFLPIRVDANLRLTQGSEADEWGWKLVLP